MKYEGTVSNANIEHSEIYAFQVQRLITLTL